MNLKEELTQIERSLWTNDPIRYEALYLSDAVLIFPEVGKINREFALAAIRKENAAGRYWAEVDFADVRLDTVTPEVALLTYEAIARWNHAASATKTLCGTVYVLKQGAWRIAFHQQTTS